MWAVIAGGVGCAAASKVTGKCLVEEGGFCSPEIRRPKAETRKKAELRIP